MRSCGRESGTTARQDSLKLKKAWFISAKRRRKKMGKEQKVVCDCCDEKADLVQGAGANMIFPPFWTSIKFKVHVHGKTVHKKKAKTHGEAMHIDEQFRVRAEKIKKRIIIAGGELLICPSCAGSKDMESVMASPLIAQGVGRILNFKELENGKD